MARGHARASPNTGIWCHAGFPWPGIPTCPCGTICYKRDKQITKNEKKIAAKTQDFNVKNLSRLLWRWAADGIYTIASCYKVMLQGSLWSSSWKQTWKSWASLRSSFFCGWPARTLLDSGSTGLSRLAASS
jgi:hypothetical protein